MCSMLIFTACDKKIDENAIFYDGFPYHQECIKCNVKYEKHLNGKLHSDLISVVPGIFLCPMHYNEFLANQELFPKTLNEIKKKYIKTLITCTFCPPPILGDAIVLNKPYNIFLPKVQYHCDKNIDEVDFIKLQEFFGDDFVITNAKSGSFIFDVIFTAATNFFVECGRMIWNKFRRWSLKKIDELTEKLLSKAGEFIVGKMLNKPQISLPNKKKIEYFINNPAFNKARIQFEEGDINLNEYMLQIVEIARNERFPLKSKYFIQIGQELEEAEKKFNDNVKSSPYELKIIITYKKENAEHEEQYEKNVNRFSYGEIDQTFLYHGCNLNRDLSNVSHVLLNQSNKFLFNSYYLTDNIFYGCFGGKDEYGPLEIDNRANLVFCKILYNKKYLERILQFPKKTPRPILQNKGAIIADIGDSSHNFLPVDLSRTSVNNIIGKEYILNDINQILPLFSFTVVRNDYFILWKNENFDNKAIELYKNELKDAQANSYFCKTDEEAIEIIQRKKNNRLKLITDKNSNLIEQAREIIGSNFLCLIFNESLNSGDRTSDKENVIFTGIKEDVIDFCNKPFTKRKYQEFIDDCTGDEENVQLNINNNDLIRFPHYNQQIEFNPNIGIRNII